MSARTWFAIAAPVVVALDVTYFLNLRANRSNGTRTARDNGAPVPSGESPN